MKAPRFIFRVLALVVILILLLIFAVASVSASPGAQQSSPPEVVVSPEFLAAASGFLLSLAFSYIPGLREKFGVLAPEIKSVAMTGLIILAALIIYGLGCAQLINTGMECTKASAWQMLVYVFYAAVANQTTFTLSPPTKSVREAKVTKYMAPPG